MVFIRPTIIRTREEARALSAQRYGYIRGRQIEHNPNVEPSLDGLVRDYLGTVPPQVAPQPGDQSFSPTPLPAPSKPQ
jgi:general secretion pathway protein D